MPTGVLNIQECLISLLDQRNIPFSTISHSSEGNTILASLLRGHDLKKAAKSMVVAIKQKEEISKYVLAVVAGDSKVDFKSMKRSFQARDACLAQSSIASELTMCQLGAIPPFSFHPDLELAVDSRLFENDEIVFNAGVLDQSIVLQIRDYEKIIDANCIRPNISRLL